MVLKSASFWLMDGIFKSCPKLFNQLSVIHGTVERGNKQTFVPLVYALMTTRDEEFIHSVCSIHLYLYGTAELPGFARNSLGRNMVFNG